MKHSKRAFALFFALAFALLLPFSTHASDDEDLDFSDDGGGMSEHLYSYNYDVNSGDAALHLSEVYAESGTVDLYDAFVETASYLAPLYIDVGSVKIYLSPNAVKTAADRGKPIPIYVKEIVTETEDSAETADVAGKTDEIPEDVVYEIDLGFEFDERSVKIQIKHKTQNAEDLRVLLTGTDDTEHEIRSAFTGNLIAFFPSEPAFSLRITEEAPPLQHSRLVVLLAAALVCLLAASAVLSVLLYKGTLKRLVLRDREASATSETKGAD